MVWHIQCILSGQERRKEDKAMKNTIAKKAGYIGAGIGLALFAIFGLLPGSLMGGAAGLNVAGWLFGMPVQPGLIARVIVLAAMLTGVLVAGIVMVTVTSTMGWLAGKVIESGVHAREAAAAAKLSKANERR
jgi:hypothetical protein